MTRRLLDLLGKIQKGAHGIVRGKDSFEAQPEDAQEIVWCRCEKGLEHVRAGRTKKWAQRLCPPNYNGQIKHLPADHQDGLSCMEQHAACL